MGSLGNFTQKPDAGDFVVQLSTKSFYEFFNFTL